ncbi:Malonyl CoA-acyl carrier protein transacylase [Enhygromyxa salina]|uniref:Malonyl CoA-acyl carrier protein transacylase n=1 Tax=Enhygromyxa salina TaxID=215803 RepID=A0A0C1ZLD7_9BACT|nr:Malonyl CoA-acyl carrier protein transacylase [Enhygromyxa salina]
MFAALERRPRRVELGPALGVVEDHAALFELQLDGLVAAGYLEIEVEGERVGVGPNRPRTEQELIRALERLAGRQASVAALVGLSRECLVAMPGILVGEVNAMALLFPGGSPERVAALYGGDPLTESCNREVARVVVAEVEARRAIAPEARVRVLEVGAGTGGTSAPVLAALAAHADAVEYVFTDVSRAFVSKGRARFGPSHGLARFEVLDIEGELEAQGFALGTYDVVIGANVFHATRRLAYTVSQAKRLLRRGGVLVLNEGTRHQHQLAQIFGLTPGWWLFTDPDHRIPGSPLATARQWRDLLASSGFEAIVARAPTTATGPAFQSLIVGRSDGLVSRPERAARPEPVAAAAASHGAVPRAPAGEAGSGAPTERRAGTLEQVTAVFARVLEMTPAQLDPDLTFENYGVDSLVVLELTRGLEALYGALPATLLFERITMRQVADWLAERADPDPAPSPAVAAGVPSSRASEAATRATPGPRPAVGDTGPSSTPSPPPVDAEAPTPSNAEAERLLTSLPDSVVDALLSELLSGRESLLEEIQG